MASNKLPIRTKLGFGVCDIGGNLFFTAMGFWTINYLTDTVGLAAGLAGITVMIAKQWDGVVDPIIGFFSDRTRSRWGRRRPFMLFGALPLLLAMWYFFTKPPFVNQIALAIWTAITLMILNTAYSIVNTPYSSLTPELTDDYHERTSLNGFRFGFAVIGTILGAAAVQPIVAAFPTKAMGFSMMGLILGSIMAVTAFVTFLSVREHGHATKELPKEGFIETYGAVFKNKPYLILLATYGLNLIGLTFVQAVLVYYTKYIYENEAMTTPAMTALLLVARVFIPVSVFVSKRLGKKRTYQISFAVIASACAAIFLFGHVLGEKFFLAMMIYAGIGIGFGYVPPWAMLPDAVEYDAVKTGKRKEGAFYGMWTFTTQEGQSLALLGTGLILSLGGYVAEAAQTASAKLAIRLLIGPIPIVVFLAALILIQFYPLDEKAYTALMAEHKAAEAKDADDL
jgi:GPH family glycoside/pentoside/hexuronide:cation symporter